MDDQGISSAGVVTSPSTGVVLPRALKADLASLSLQSQRRIRKMAGDRPWRFTVQMASAWAVIGTIISIAEYVDRWWISILAILFIATRQDMLGLLVHEQAHMLGYRTRWGDVLVNTFCAYPLVVLSVEGYAQVHLTHHRYYFTEQDPDFIRKNGREWTFPMPLSRLMRILISEFFGLYTLKTIRGKKPSQSENERPQIKRRHPTSLWYRWVYFSVVVTILTSVTTFTSINAWRIFAIYWVLPLFTVEQVINRWGAIGEHYYNLPSAPVIESTPIIELSWLERILMPNLNFSLHAYHHFYPTVAWYYLPEIHEIFRDEGLVNEAGVFHGYIDYLRFLISGDRWGTDRR